MNSTAPRVLAGFGLALAALVGSAVPAGADAGLTVTARYAQLGDSPDVVVLVGRYTCGPYPGGVPDRGVLDLSVVQTTGGVTTTGIGYLEPQVCTGRPQPYAVELVAYTGSFVAGAGTWSGSGYVEGGGGMENTHVPPTPIRIRPAAG